ncbi:hypothetical protein Prudu_005045 [Prunus dulcis]|uniref:PORR domain-containing protein n=1 Tax=Prunus dulcis TaxID=3755 RepID=A0A4Y1QWR0_PRUDU|nr:hypothetical protein Prudu_005045 [Prunus dulcis]
MFSRALEFSPAFPPSPLSPDHVTATPPPPPPPLFFFFLPNAATHTPPSPPMATQIASLLLLNASSPAAASPQPRPRWMLPSPRFITIRTFVNAKPSPGLPPHLNLTPQTLSLHKVESTIHTSMSNKYSAIERLAKLLMLARVIKLPMHLINRLKWDLGPHDILGTLVDDFSDYSGAFEVEDVGLPYSSPYENATHLSPNSDQAENYMVAVVHERGKICLFWESIWGSKVEAHRKDFLIEKHPLRLPLFVSSVGTGYKY